MLCTILGAPGAGKGTQALFLKEKLGVPIIATGNLLRDAMKAETELGKSIKEYMNTGHLVPDDLIVDLVSKDSKMTTAKTAPFWMVSRELWLRPKE